MFRRLHPAALLGACALAAAAVPAVANPVAVHGAFSNALTALSAPLNYTGTFAQPVVSASNAGKGAGLAGNGAQSYGVTGTTTAPSVLPSNPNVLTVTSAGVLGADNGAPYLNSGYPFTQNAGVYGTSTYGYGVVGALTNTKASGVAVLGYAPAGGFAGAFLGGSGQAALGAYNQSTGNGATIGSAGPGGALKAFSDTGPGAWLGSFGGSIGASVFSETGEAFNASSFNPGDGIPVAEVDANTNFTGGSAASQYRVGIFDITLTPPTASGAARYLHLSEHVYQPNVGAYDLSDFDVTQGGNGFFRGNVALRSSPLAVTQTTGGTAYVAYTGRTTDPTIQTVGEAKLSAGKATIALPKAFASVLGASYSVILTPEGDSKGLYVAQKTASGFSVHENAGGTSSVAFSYQVVGRVAEDASLPSLPAVQSNLAIADFLAHHSFRFPDASTSTAAATAKASMQSVHSLLRQAPGAR